MMRSFSKRTEKLINAALLCGCVSVSGQLQAVDLVTFGQACLKQESYLNTLKRNIDEADFARHTSKDLNQGARANLRSYNRQLNELEPELQACQKNAPNSRTCHDIRIRHNRLTELADRAEQRLDKQHDALNLDPPQTLFFRQQRYHDVYDQFIAMCRDSDVHYQLIQDPNAYQQVCGSGSNKASITCSLF
ncbi:hypothetical protein [Marinomonas pollencensis]|uniref:Lysozyme inhibitor LprI N-terminal domain-containing protein n=1 Tax=Marinomonas pollencensis TaxID=491954 RepID=A0A3E0DUM4_9GAMM|nr:hypothetical protein [Marinomonas pollencensis]REG86575.1 hypothetical protein DFP81_101140 [Marinomonas pollencensis]